MPHASVPVVIVERQTVEWQYLSDQEFLEQSRRFCDLWGKPRDYIWQLFQLWNNTFSVDYRIVRQALKNLSRQNFQSANNTTIVPYRHYKNIPEQSAYYLFLDDDDWVAPDISQQISRQLVNMQTIPELLLWRSANIGSPQQEHIVFVWGMNGRCMTNNYAVHSSWLRPFSKINQVLQHKDAVIVFESQQGIPHLDCALTVSNKSPISSVSLDRGLGGELSSPRLLMLVEQYLERMHRVQDSELVYISWSREYITRTVQIFDEVLNSRR